MQRGFPLAVLAMALGCGGNRLANDTGSLQVQDAAVAFPLTWIGFPNTRQLRITNTAAGARHAELTTTAPFSAPASIDVPGGASADVTIRFAPVADGAQIGTLAVSTDEGTVSVALSGDAKSSPTCTGGTTCSPARFDALAGACTTVLAADDTACADDACLVDGHCKEGVCIGAPRDCSDGDACTSDACDPQLGCVHQDVSAACPPPADLCHVATCDASGGCGTTAAPDGTLCGSASCQEAHVCLLGRCMAVTPPDGFECAPATPCRAPATCESGQCVAPVAQMLQPEWTFSLPDPVDQFFMQGVMADAQGNLYFSFRETWQLPDGGLPATNVFSLTSDGFERFHATAPYGWGLLGVEHDEALVDAAGLVALSTFDGGVVFQIDGGGGVAVAVARETAALWSFSYGMEVEWNGDVIGISLVDGGETWRLAGEHQTNCASVDGYPCFGGTIFSQPIADGAEFFMARDPISDGGGPVGDVAFDQGGQLVWQSPEASPPTIVAGSNVLTTSGSLLGPAGVAAGQVTQPNQSQRIIVGDDRVVWTEIYEGNPDGGAGPGDPHVEALNARTGALVGDAVANPSSLVMTAGRSVVVDESGHLSEMSETGDRLWACELPTAVALYETTYWGWGTSPLLANGHYVRIAQLNPMGTPQRYRVESYALPGIDLARSGWVMFGGNPGRTNHPR